MIESLGSHSNSDDQAAGLLFKSLVTSSTRPSKQYSSTEEMAKKRVERDLGGTLSFEAAKILCERGHVRSNESHESGHSFRWAFDPALKNTSRYRLNSGAICSFFQRITTKNLPVLLVLADDGIYKKAIRAPVNLLLAGKTHRYWIALGFLKLMWLYVSLHLAIHRMKMKIRTWLLGGRVIRLGSAKKQSISEVTTNAVSLLQAEPRKKNAEDGIKRALSSIETGFDLLRRVRSAREVMKIVRVSTGGHHVHLTQADTVALAIKRWLKAVNGL